MLSIWNPQTSEGEISYFNIATKDIGTLHLSLRVQGITQDISKKLVKMATTNANLSDQETSEIMKQIELKDFTIRFEDDSITNRALDRLAEKQKTTRKNLITQAQLMLPLIINQRLGGSNFGKKLGPELGTFLQAPKSLKISFFPSQAISVAKIAEMIPVSATDTLQMLNADVTANQ